MTTPETTTPNAALTVRRIQPAYQQVSEQLREQIVSGKLRPGERLPAEAELSGSFGVSRSTVREALRVLGSQGLIRTLRGVTGGTFVAEVDAGAISDLIETRLGLLTGHHVISAADLLEARQLLEVPAARLAAERRNDDDVEAMRRAIELERAETERGRRFAQHQLFHAALLDAAGNRLIGLMTVPIFRVIRTRFLADQPRKGFWHEVDCDHEDILARVEAGDADGAALAMEEHLRRLRVTYRDETADRDDPL